MAERKIFQMDLDPSLIKIKKVLNTQDFIELEIWGISNHYPTNNNNYFPVETMKQNIEDNNFYGKPVLGRFNNITDNYEVHNSKQKWDPEFNQEYTDYEDKGERPLGFCHDPNVRLEKDKNGDTWCVFNVVLWVKYGYRGIKKILKTGVGKVSAEVSVYQSHYDENGIEIFDKWTFDGITILGYKKGTTVEAHEGIEHAHRCITDKMKEKIYSDKLLKIQRTFEADMEEFNSDIYKNNKEKGERLLDNQAKTGAKEEFVIEEILEEVEETPLGVEEVENEAIPEEECNNSEVEEAAEEPVAECNNEEGEDEESEKPAEECNNSDEGEDEEVEKEPEEECNNEEKEPEDAEEPEEECKNADEGEDEEVAKEEPEEEPAEECNNSDEGEDEEVEKEPEEPAEECGNFEEAPEEGCDDCEPEEECNTHEAEESVIEEKEFELSDGTKVDAERLYQVYLEALLEQDSLKKEFNEVKAELEEYKKQEAFNKVEALKAEVHNFAKDKNIDSSLVAKIVKQCEEGEITDFLTAKKDMVFALYEKTEATEVSNHSFVAKVEEISINQKSKKMKSVDPIQGLADFLKN